jgi:alkylhydroperoxidase family enzyme
MATDDISASVPASASASASVSASASASASVSVSVSDPAPRLPAAPGPDSEAVTTALARLMPPGVPPLLLFRTLATNERVLLRVLASGLLDKGTLSLRERELVIDRTCARLGSEYEWGVHVAFFGPKAGLSPDDIVATTAVPPPASLPECEQLLLRLVDELVDTATVGDGLWAQLAAAYRPEQLVELLVLVGSYHLISFVTNALRLPPEPFAARFPVPPTPVGR